MEIVIFSVSAVSFEVGEVNTQSLTCVSCQQMEIVVTYRITDVIPEPHESLDVHVLACLEYELAVILY